MIPASGRGCAPRQRGAQLSHGVHGHRGGQLHRDCRDAGPAAHSCFCAPFCAAPTLKRCGSIPAHAIAAARASKSSLTPQQEEEKLKSAPNTAICRPGATARAWRVAWAAMATARRRGGGRVFVPDTRAVFVVTALLVYWFLRVLL